MTECKGMQPKRGLGLVLMFLLPGFLGACQPSVFSQSDNYMRSRIDRYWDGDSAEALRAARSRAAENGFGFPVGMANQ
jgi:hypothetical protein